jgi:hypothetical protein
MSKVTGALLIVAGLGSAAYALSQGLGLSPSFFQSTPDVASTRETALPAAMTSTARPESQRIEAPLSASPSAAIVSKPQAPSLPAAAPSTPPAASKPAPPLPAAPAPASQAWPPFVTLARREGEGARIPVTAPQRPSAFPADRASLARDLQRELRRAGCYDGEVNAVWTTSTRRAMKTFMDRVNATLPIEEPDSVLLALVQSHPDGVCAKPCPAGQGLSDAGRCVPAAMLARAATKGAVRHVAGIAPKGQAPQQPAIGSWTTSTTAAAPAIRMEPPEGRMALAGPGTGDGALPLASAMPSAGVSVLAAPERAGDAAARQYGEAPPPTSERRRAPREARGNWARSFWKRRDGVF